MQPLLASEVGRFLDWGWNVESSVKEDPSKVNGVVRAWRLLEWDEDALP